LNRGEFSPIRYTEIVRLCALLVLLAGLLPSARAYSVLTHEAIIDSVWDPSIKPLLLKRFPNATADDLLKAHAYAYGGAIIQDMGYYPFGNKFFSDLVHYVRAGDFVVNLIAESTDLNEYAFALGALAHDAADNEGHALAVNKVVPMQYPELKAKFGNVVTYAENPEAHLKTEFAFDVDEVARGHYAPQSYHDFIGFEVADDVLRRAFRDTYALDFDKLFFSEKLALGTYRYTVSSMIPEMTKVAWDLKKDDLMKSTPGITRRKFVYNLSRSSYRKEWGNEYRRPGCGARLIAAILRVIPKFGPFKALKFEPLTPESQKLFMASFNAAIDRYRTLLAELNRGNLTLPNTNLDTGRPISVGVYSLADDTFAKLLDKLASANFTGVPPKLRDSILAYYAHPAANPEPKDVTKKSTDAEKLRRELDQLRSAEPSILGKEKANSAQ
jgi:hypothetical protein